MEPWVLAFGDWHFPISYKGYKNHQRMVGAFGKPCKVKGIWTISTGTVVSQNQLIRLKCRQNDPGYWSSEALWSGVMGNLMEGTQAIPEISCLEKDFSVTCRSHWYIWSSLLLVLTIRMTCWHRWNSFQLFSYQRGVPSLRKRWQFDPDWRCPSRWIVSRILAMNTWSNNNSSDNSSWLYNLNPSGFGFWYTYIIHTYVKIS